jgi:hypothetical protein
MNRLAAIVLLTSTAGCASLGLPGRPATLMRLVYDNDAMSAEVLKYLSVGMPIENAKRVMEANGFECEYSLYAGGLEPSDHETPCLRCRIWFGIHFLVEDDIDVWVYYEAGCVKDVRVDCLSIGP